MRNLQRPDPYSSEKARRACANRALLCLVIALVSSACATPYDPFKIPDSELRERVKTIALAPLSVNPLLVDRSYARSQIEPLATARLTAGGFQVVPSEEMEKLWLSIATDVGELFDPVSGEVNDERYEAVESAVYRDLHSIHGVDAVLYLGVKLVYVHIPKGQAGYCGRTDDLYWPERKIGFADRLAGHHVTLAGTLCLEAKLFDMEERNIYGIRGGLEVFETYVWQTRYTRPVEERLHNLERLNEVIEVVVGPLADAARGR